MEEAFSKLAVRAAYGWGRDQNWVDALTFLGKAAEAGEPNAVRQLELVSQAPIEQLTMPPPVQGISRRSRIGIAKGFAPPGFSEWLIERALPGLEPAPVNDASGQAIRSALTTPFGPQDRDLVLAILQERAARVIQAPIEFHEPPNVISYEPGQEFTMHVDFVNPAVPEFQAELRQMGQRTATFITYLNDDFEGAETVFPDIGFSFRGAPGDALIFANVLPDGSPDVATRHCGLPPTRGRKWVLSQWIRAKPYPYRPEQVA
jgi:prolyl 4-hydroxylase